MKKVLLALVVIVVLGVAFILLLGTFFGGDGGGVSSRVPSKVILEADFETNLVEFVPVDPFAQLTGQEIPQLRDAVEALEQAASDERVVGLVARVGEGGMGFARLQELRTAVEAFRASGKPAIAWSETFGEVGSGNASYYLATAFDEIHLQPSGDVNLTGLRLESMFLRGTLDKLDVEPNMYQRYEYKNAMNTFTHTEFTEPHREALGAVMDSVFGQMVDAMAASRGLDPAALETLIDDGPFFGREAVDHALVDGLAYRDEVYARAMELMGDDAKRLYLGTYLERAGRPYDDGSGVALIYGVGGIGRGESGYNPFDGSVSMGSETVARAFRDAIEDRSVEAILFRIDCPGGSYVASDTVWREVVRAKEAGKPVIVSFGDVAASGGYFVAAEATKIVAQPGTITGSIGVLGGKLVTREAFGKLGFTFDAVQTSDNATMWSGLQPYTEAEEARFNTWLDRVYDDFTGKVADGRGLPIERVREIAKGRIWSGEDALEIGLVDALGGFDVALDLVRQELGLESDADLNLEIFPEQRSPWEDLFGQGPDNSGPTGIHAALAHPAWAHPAAAQALEAARPYVVLAQKLGLVPPTVPQTLAYPEEWIPKP